MRNAGARIAAMMGAGLTIVAIAPTSSAGAFNQQSWAYPGLFCVETNILGNADVKFDNTGSAENMASSSRDFQCPAIHFEDPTINTETVSLFYVSGTRSSASANTTWNVGLWSANELGTAGWVSTASIPTGAGGFVNIAGVPGELDWYTQTTGQLRIYTTVPAGCKVSSYTVFEGCITGTSGC